MRKSSLFIIILIFIVTLFLLSNDSKLNKFLNKKSTKILLFSSLFLASLNDYNTTILLLLFLVIIISNSDFKLIAKKNIKKLYSNNKFIQNIYSKIEPFISSEKEDYSKNIENNIVEEINEGKYELEENSDIKNDQYNDSDDDNDSDQYNDSDDESDDDSNNIDYEKKKLSQKKINYKKYKKLKETFKLLESKINGLTN